MGLGLTLTVIVIFLVIWIVSNVIRAQQDAAQAAARRNTNRSTTAVTGRTPEKTSSSDIDRFLQEIDRLRKKGTQEQGEAKKTAPTVERVPEPRREQPPRRTQSERKRGSGGRPPVVVPPPPPPAPLPSLADNTFGTKLESPTVAPPPPVPQSQIVKPVKPVRPVKPVKPIGPHKEIIPLTPTMQILQGLLKNRQTMAAAFVLQEILGKPKSQRS